MNDRQFNWLYLLALVFTVVALVIYPYLPKREVLLLPNSTSWAFSNADADSGGKSTAQWLNTEYSLWECDVRVGASAPNCGFGISFSSSDSDWSAGIDFSQFDQIAFHFHYSGPASTMRLFARNFDPVISNSSDHNSTQFMQITIRRADFDLPLAFDLSEFKLADWWVSQFDVPRSHGRPQIDRLTTIGIDFGDNKEVPYGKHRIEIEHFKFIGAYITQQHWYLGILVLWMVGIAARVAYQFNVYYRHAKQDRERLNEMSNYARELKSESELYKNLSKTDALTSTYNRYGLQERVSDFIEKRVNDDVMGVVVVDIDHFKCVNDIFGHDVGDQVLSMIGALLRESTRSIDTVARWGGEEFVLLCPQTEGTALIIMAEKIRQQISELHFPMRAKLSITASFGLAIIEPDQQFDEVFKRADEALYKAKSQGRNCCVMDNHTPKMY
ncbi:GGDEF domain-containing protein [Alteromonadaceae bacterium BrNp21-10]|nr:GGDEF domain-containing protein [Alteromonadaceae bacterium BrNp21-10]